MQLVELIRHELEIALRTRRVLVVALLYLGAALLGGMLVVWGLSKAEALIVEQAQAQGSISADEVRALIAENGEQALRDALDSFDVEVDDLAQPLTNSVVAPVFFWCSLAFLPFLIVLTTFDTFASDLQARSLCFITLRTARWQTVVARLASQTLIFSIVTALAAAALFGFAVWRLDSLAAPQAMTSWAYGVALLVPYGAAYVAVTTFCSASTPKPMGALIRAVGLLIALRLCSLPDSLIDDDAAPHWLALRFLRYVSPAWYHDGMWQAVGLDLALSIAAYVTFTATFGTLAVVVIGRRDL